MRSQYADASHAALGRDALDTDRLSDWAPALLVTKRELAKRLGVSVPTVTSYVSRAIIPSVVPGTRRYSWLAVEETLRLRRVSPARTTEAEEAEQAFQEFVMRHGRR